LTCRLGRSAELCPDMTKAARFSEAAYTEHDKNGRLD
jgi:hypothetical protein